MIRLNDKIPQIDIKELIRDNKIIIIDDFYESLEWMNDKSIVNIEEKNKDVQVFHIKPSIRHTLLEKVSKILPDTYYAADTGWIRANLSTADKPPAASLLHEDPSYLVIGVCLSSPINEDNNSYGTVFCKHRDFGFKKIKNSLERKIFNSHILDDEKWEQWFEFSFKKNRAIIYDASLLHKMPWPIFGETLADSRIMQVFNFRAIDQRLARGEL